MVATINTIKYTIENDLTKKINKKYTHNLIIYTTIKFHNMLVTLRVGDASVSVTGWSGWLGVVGLVGVVDTRLV